MGSVAVEKEIAGEVGKVWALMSDFGNLRAWNSEIESCEVEGEGVGAVRTFSMGGITIKERLEAWDEATKSYSYSITEGPIPAKNYLAKVVLEDLGGTRTKVLWTSDFDAEGASEDDLIKLFEGIYSAGIAAVEKTVAVG